jgi:tripartite-type tricarboxylate transporter receptor subunit TctC
MKTSGWAAAVVVIMGCWAASPQPALAADWPTKPVNLIVCYGAGGSTDVVVRAISDQLGKVLGVPAVVLNKPGSGGLLGAEFVANSPPDGYNVLVISLSHLLRQIIEPQIQVDVFKHFEPVSRFVSQPLLLAVGKDSKFKTMEDLIAYAKANPRKASYGTAGIGATSHFASELFASETGTEHKHVPFKGDADATTAMMGGHVDWSVTGLQQFAGKAAAGEIRVLGCFSETRLAEMKDVPTFYERGYKGAIMYSWFGFAVPAKTPKEIVQKLNSAIEKAMKDPVSQSNIKNVMFNEFYAGPEEFAKFMRSDFDRFKAVADKTGIVVK